MINREHRYAAYIGFMIGLLLALLLLSGCATTDASYADPNGKTVTWKSRTLWKDIQEVEVEWGDLKTSLGSSAGNGNEVVIACLIAPQLSGCQR